MSDKAKGNLLIISAAFIWTFAAIIAQITFKNSSVTSEFMTTVRMLIAGIALGSVLFIKEKKKSLDILKSKKGIFGIIFYAIGCQVLIMYSFMETVKYSSAAVATLLQFTSPVFVLIVRSVMKKKFPSVLQIVCVISALVGLFFLTAHGKAGNLEISSRAIIWGLISAGGLTLTTIYPQGLIKEYGALSVQSYGMIIGGIFCTLFFRPFGIQTGLTPILWILLIVASVSGCGIAFCLYLTGVKLSSPEAGSILGNAEPLSSAIFSILFLNMSCTSWDLAGIFLIIFSAVLLGAKGN